MTKCRELDFQLGGHPRSLLGRRPVRPPPIGPLRRGTFAASRDAESRRSEVRWPLDIIGAVGGLEWPIRDADVVGVVGPRPTQRRCRTADAIADLVDRISTRRKRIHSLPLYTTMNLPRQIALDVPVVPGAAPRSRAGAMAV